MKFFLDTANLDEIREAVGLYPRIAPNVVVKCPLTRNGLKATRRLTAEGPRGNVTLCFSGRWRQSSVH